MSKKIDLKLRLKTSWNYRVCTRKEDRHRIFKICEVYYKDGEPSGYIETKSILVWESIKDLKFTVKKLQEVFSKPILDLDNWPNEYKKPKKK